MATRAEILRAIEEWSQNTIDSAGRTVKREAAISIDLLTRLFEQESGLSPTALSKSGARGIGQVMPSTWADFLGRHPRLPAWFSADDPRSQVLVGTDHLGWLLTKYQGVVPAPHRAAVAAYHAGHVPIDESIKAAGQRWEPHFFGPGKRPQTQAHLDAVLPGGVSEAPRPEYPPLPQGDRAAVRAAVERARGELFPGRPLRETVDRFGVIQDEVAYDRLNKRAREIYWGATSGQGVPPLAPPGVPPEPLPEPPTEPALARTIAVPEVLARADLPAPTSISGRPVPQELVLPAAAPAPQAPVAERPPMPELRLGARTSPIRPDASSALVPPQTASMVPTVTEINARLAAPSIAPSPATLGAPSGPPLPRGTIAAQPRSIAGRIAAAIRPSPAAAEPVMPPQGGGIALAEPPPVPVAPVAPALTPAEPLRAPVALDLEDLERAYQADLRGEGNGHGRPAIDWDDLERAYKEDVQARPARAPTPEAAGAMPFSESIDPLIGLRMPAPEPQPALTAEALPPAMPAPVEPTLRAAKPEDFGPSPEPEATGPADLVTETSRAIVAGLKSSVVGNLFHYLNPHGAPGTPIEAGPGMYEATVRGLAQFVGDIPVLMSGARLGGAAGKQAVEALGQRYAEALVKAGMSASEAARLIRTAFGGSRIARTIMGTATTGGAVAAQSGAQEASQQLAREGEITAPGKIAVETAKGAALGAGAGVAGAATGLVADVAGATPLTQDMIQAVSQAGYYAAIAPIIQEGRTPTLQDLVTLGIPALIISGVAHMARARPSEPQILPPGEAPRGRPVGRGTTARPEPQAPQGELAAPPAPPAPPTAGPAVPAPADVGRPPAAPARKPRKALPALAPPTAAPALLPIDRFTTALDPRTGRGIVDPEEFLGVDPRTGYGVLKPEVAPQAPQEAPEAAPPAAVAPRPAVPPVAPPAPAPAPTVPAEAPPAAPAPVAPSGAGQQPPMTPMTPKVKAVLNAISSTQAEDAYVVARGQRLKVQQSNYGMFGRAIGGDIRLTDGSEISATLVDRVEDAAGRVLWERAAPPVPAPAPVAAPETPPAAPEEPRDEDWLALRSEADQLLQDFIQRPGDPKATADEVKRARALLPRFDGAPADLVALRRRIAGIIESAGAEPPPEAARPEPAPAAPARPMLTADTPVTITSGRYAGRQGTVIAFSAGGNVHVELDDGTRTTQPVAGLKPVTPTVAPPVALAPATRPAVPGAYEHSDRLQRITRLFEQQIREQNQLPTDPRALRAMVAQELGLQPGAFTADAALMDDLQDAIEAAVNKVYRERRPDADLRQQLTRAEETERWLGNRIRTLELTKRQQFSTPLPLAEAGAHALDLRAGDTVGEPTAGTGNLLAPLPLGTPVVVNELDPRRAQALRLQGYEPTVLDYLRTNSLAGRADVIFMNPPWGKHSTQRYGQPIPMPYGEPADVAERFFVKALTDVRPEGRVVAIMPTTVLKAPKFLDWLRQTHTLRALVQAPPHAYDTRGTTVGSVILVVDKGRIQGAPEAIRGAAADWDEFARLLAPLAVGGTHARAGGAERPPRALPEPAREPAGGPAGRPAEPAPRPSGAAPVPRPTEPRAPGTPVPRGAGREPEAGVPGVSGGPAARGGEPRPEVVPVGVGGGGVEPEGAPSTVSERSDSPPRAGEPTFVEGVGAERYSVADPAELDAARHSAVFIPAPLRRSPGVNPHPRLIVRTRSLAGAKLPELTYEPKGRMIADAYRRKVISDQQLDYGILPSLQADQQGHGYLFAADVGVGKTRVAAAIIGEWLETGKYKRVLYVTNSEVNVQDAIGEFNVYAGKPYPYDIIPVRSFPGAKERQGKSPEDREALPAPERAVYAIDHYNLAEFEAALKDLDLDAVVGDEVHLLRNIDEAKVGQAWNRLQLGVLAKRGGFLYLSATPATDFDDLKQFVGLREWAPGGFEDYVARVTGSSPEAQGDVGALRSRLESLTSQWQGLRDVPDDEKQRLIDSLPDTESWGAGLVENLRDAIDQVENALSDKAQAPTAAVGGDADDIRRNRPGKRRFGGRDVFSAHVTPAEQEQVMRELAMRNKYDSIDLWRAGVDFEITTNPLSPEQTAEYARLSEFMRTLNRDFLRWGRLNKSTGRLLTIRHFLQQEAKRRMFDYRLDHAIRLAKESLDRGEQPVISLINVNEGTEKSGPIPAAINSINIRQVETDPDTGEITLDEEIPEAIQRRADLLDQWAEFRQVPNPVDRIVGAFGRENVAAIIGKTSPAMREKMIREFQQGERKVAVISGAGKVGISLHHIVDIPGAAKGRRHMIVADYEWSAEKFKQELGRVDRSGQRSAPRITPLSTGQAGEKKFLATIANRMRNLGALSKGSAESASNDKLAEFEIGGGLDTHAMRLAYRALDPDIQQKFLATSFRDPQDRERNTSAYPQNANLKDFLLDIQFLEPEDGNRAFEEFWTQRERLIAEHEETAEKRAGRTRAYRGDIVRSVNLRPDLTLHEVRDEHGQHYGLLQGIVTPHLARIARYLEESERSGLPIRKYVTFQAGDRQLAGLEIRAGSMAPLTESFGKSAARQLDTPEQIIQALQAGDKMPLEGRESYILRMRPSDKRLQVQGAKMADRAALQRAGAAYAPVGNFWFVPEENLPQFLERYPVKPPAPPETSFMAAPVGEGFSQRRIGMISPEGEDHFAEATVVEGHREDHTEMVRRLLGNRDAGINEARDRGFVRYWRRADEIALDFDATNQAAARNALGFLRREYERGDRIYVDARGVQEHFFEQPWRAAEAIRSAAGLPASFMAAPAEEGVAPPFFSALQRAIEDRMPERASVEQVRAILRGPVVKAEEVKWTGVEDWLEGKPRVSKPDLLEFLRQNEVWVEEVVRPSRGFTEPDPARALGALQWSDAVQEDLNLTSRGAGRGLFTVWHGSGTSPHGRVERATITEMPSRGYVLDAAQTQNAAFDTLEDAKRGAEQGIVQTTLPTKFGQWQLAGGRDYRELLLTLPQATSERLAVVQHPRRPEGFALQKPDGTYVSSREGTPIYWESRDYAERYGRRAHEGAEYLSTHWDEPNVLAHVRFNDRVDAEGKRVLLIEEVQSDWHQTGRQEGYRQSVDPSMLSARESTRVSRGTAANLYGSISAKAWDVIGPGDIKVEILAVTPTEAVERAAKQLSERGVPPAPFAKTWQELALKRMLRFSAEHGYDKLAFTTGEMQAERYDLSKQVLRIEYEPVEERLRAIDPQGDPAIDRRGVAPEQVADYVGKDVADKLLKTPLERRGMVRMALERDVGPDHRVHSLAGLDLKIGGEGMKGFYDQILPAFLNKYAKKWGARVGTTEIILPRQGVSIYPEDITPASLKANLARTERVPAIDITPAMRESVLREGQPLFMGAGGFPSRVDVAEGLWFAPQIPNSPHRLADTTGLVPTERLRAMAESAHVQALAPALDDVYRQLADRLALDNAKYAESYFFGLGVDPTYYGLNTRTAPASFAVIANAHAIARTVNGFVRVGAIDAAERPREAARLLVNVLLHEATHQEVRGHADPDTDFAQAYARNLETTEELRSQLVDQVAGVLGGPDAHYEQFLAESTQLQAERARARRAVGTAADVAGSTAAIGGAGGAPSGEPAGARPEADLGRGAPGEVSGLATGPELGGGLPEPIRVTDDPPVRLERDGWRRIAGLPALADEGARQVAEGIRRQGDEVLLQRLSPTLRVVWRRPAPVGIPEGAAPPSAGVAAPPAAGPPGPPAPPAPPPGEPPAEGLGLAPQGEGRPTDADRADPAEPLVVGGEPTTAPPRPPNIGNPLVPTMWRNPEADVVEGWRLAQRAEATMQWGAVFGEHLLRQFRRSIAAPYHFRASEYLDTGDAELLEGLPEAARAGIEEYRALMERYAAYAQAAGELHEDHVIEHYFSHLLQGPERAVADASKRFANARQHSPFFRERTIPTLSQLERWLEQEGFAARGVRVVRDPALVARAYVTAYHRAEALREMAHDLATSLTAEGEPVLMGAERRGALTEQPGGYVAFEHPLFRAAVGNQLPLLDERYAPAMVSILAPSPDSTRWLSALDSLNNLHRGIVMALPWKHGLFNVGVDALLLTGLWRGIVHGEWLAIRREGYRMLQDLDPFLERLVRDGGFKVPLIHAPLEEVRRSLSEMIRGARLPWSATPVPGSERLARFWENFERATWEKMVSGWMIGLSKLLLDRADAGRMPQALMRSGITQEAWSSMAEAEKMKAIGRVVSLLSGQMPRTLFKNPEMLRRLRWIFFSPSWNISNIGMVQAALRAEGSFALRGLRPAERRVVEGFAQEYGTRSVALQYLLSALLQVAIGAAITGTIEWMWDNPPGLRTRIWIGNDDRGRGRFAMSPIGYMAKDVQNAVHAAWRLAHFDWKPAGEVVRSKLALVPKAAIALLGYVDPYDSWINKLEGRGIGDRLLDAAEATGDEFVPVTAFQRDPEGAVLTWLGVPIRHGMTSKSLRGRLGIEMRDFNAAIKWASRNKPGMVDRLREQQQRRREEMTELIQAYQRFEAKTAGEGPLRRAARGVGELAGSER